MRISFGYRYKLSNYYRISVSLNGSGELHLSINNKSQGCHLSSLPMSTSTSSAVSFWLLLDIYGSTQSIQFVSEGTVQLVIIYLYLHQGNLSDISEWTRKRNNCLFKTSTMSTLDYFHI